MGSVVFDNIWYNAAFEELVAGQNNIAMAVDIHSGDKVADWIGQPKQLKAVMVYFEKEGPATTSWNENREAETAVLTEY